MGYQLRFFYTQTAEARILEMSQTLGMRIFSVPRTPSQLALGFSEPPPRWVFADEFIQFSRPSLRTLNACIYFHPYKTDLSRKSVQICNAYDALSKTIKKHSTYFKARDLWVFSDLHEEFSAAFQQDQSQLAAGMRGNREYAVNGGGRRY